MAYTPVSTMFNTPYGSATVLSPLTPLSVSPVSPVSTIRTFSPVTTTIRSISPLSPLSTISQSVVVSTNPLTIVSPLVPRVLITKPSYVVDIDTGMDDNYIVQKDVTKYLMYKALDKWLFKEFPSVLKYLIVDKDNVRVVKNESEKDKNEISKDSKSVNEKKADWIEENILTEFSMRDVLIRIMRELGLKWYELPHREDIVCSVVEKYIKKKLKSKMESS